MQITVDTRSASDVRTAMLVLLLPKLEGAKWRPPPRIAAVDRALDGQIAAVIASGDFRGGTGEALLLYPGAEIPAERLQALGLKLGADVPVFVFGRTAFAEGIGERLQAIHVDPAWYLVVVPQVAVSTAEIFSAPELTRNSKAIKIAAFSIAEGHNDLAPVACKRYPEIARCLQWLEQFGKAAMSGSGASVFVAFDSEASARAALGQLPADMKGFVARGLDRHPMHAVPD